MKKIKLSQNKFSLIDDEDFELVNQFKWCASENRNTFYAQRGSKINGKRKTIKMHRLIMGVDDPKIIIDHINRNGLDNRRSNLRIVTQSENNRNRRLSKNKFSSKYRGVYRNRNRYFALMSINGHRLSLGYYDNEEDANKAYLKAIENPLKTLENLLKDLIQNRSF